MSILRNALTLPAVPHPDRPPSRSASLDYAQLTYSDYARRFNRALDLTLRHQLFAERLTTMFHTTRDCRAYLQLGKVAVRGCPLSSY
eukprot:COSAG01_NODE_3511_length_5986_cov_35.145915_4_plen_87_part_00